MSDEKTPYEAFLARMASMAVYAGERASIGLYERFKAEFMRSCPDATPDQYTHAMRMAARAAGV